MRTCGVAGVASAASATSRPASTAPPLRRRAAGPSVASAPSSSRISRAIACTSAGSSTCFSARKPASSSRLQSVLIRRGMPPVSAWISVEARRLELRIVLPADVLQAMLDVGLRLRLVERAEVIRRDDALAQLLHLRALHHRRGTRAGRPGSSAAAPGRRAGSSTACAAPRPRAASGSAPRRRPAARACLSTRELAQERLERRQQHRLVDRPAPAGRTPTPTARSMSSASSCVLTSCAATTLSRSSCSSRLRTIVVLPAPISPVMTMKPSLW